MEKPQAYSVLILDDDPMIVDSLKGAFRRRGFIAWGTADAEEAIRFVQAHRPSVACIDLEMPRMNGIQVIQKMREVMPDIRVIVVTAYFSTYRTQVEALKVRVVEKGSETHRELEAVICEELALSRQEFEALKTRKKKRLPLRILFVDDEREIADFSCQVVVSEGIEAESAYSPEEALEKAKSFKPNVLCTDLKMQTMDGDELIKRMKASSEYSSVKVYVAITGFSEHKDKLFEAGAAEVLVKPWNLTEFMEAMERWASLINV